MTGYQEILTDPSYAGPDRHAHLSAHRQRRRQRRGRRVATRLRRGARHPRPAARSRRAGAARTTSPTYLRQQQHRRHRRHRHAQAHAAPARARARRTAASSPRPGSTTRPRPMPCRARARCPSMAGLDLAKVVTCTQALRLDGEHVGARHRLPADGRAALPRRRVRLRRQAQHPAHARRARLPRDRGAGADARARRAGDEARRRLPVATAPAIRSLATTRSRRSARSSRPACRRSASASATSCSASPPADDAQDEVRPPRRQPSGAGPDTGQVLITSQNHGFAVDPATLPANVRVTHVSLFDGTLQGFALTDKPAFCFQGHPEASPGPHDVATCSTAS